MSVWWKLDKEHLPDDLVLVSYDYDGNECFDLGTFNMSKKRWEGSQELTLDAIVAFQRVRGPDMRDLETEDEFEKRHRY